MSGITRKSQAGRQTVERQWIQEVFFFFLLAAHFWKPLL